MPSKLGLPDPAKDLLSKGEDAGKDAARAANEQALLAIEQLEPFRDVGIEQLGALTQGTTAAGLDERLREILDTDIFGSLVEERTRGVQGQLSAGGLTRSGTALQEISSIGPDLALQLEGLLTGRSQNLVGIGQASAAGVGANLVQQGQNTASGILAGGQAEAQNAQNAIALAGIAAMFFSDRRLKTNAEQVSEIMGLPIWEYDFIPEAKGTIIEHGPTIGFMADEVQERYPHLVGEYGGWLFVDYGGVLDALKREITAEHKTLQTHEGSQCPH